MQTLKPPQGREPPKAVSISPLFFPPQDCPKGPVGDNLAVVQALGPEGLDIGGWNLRAAFPKCVRGTRSAEATRCLSVTGSLARVLEFPSLEFCQDEHISLS